MYFSGGVTETSEKKMVSTNCMDSNYGVTKYLQKLSYCPIEKLSIYYRRLLTLNDFL
jgi:hypothetical protein